jgi:hypothetical protein
LVKNLGYHLAIGDPHGLNFIKLFYSVQIS